MLYGKTYEELKYRHKKTRCINLKNRISANNPKRLLNGWFGHL